MKARRKIASWALITVLFAQSFGVNILFGLYAVDKPVFVELFCVNKDKPKMHCDGSCMLTKLDEQKNQDSDKPILLNITQFQVYFHVQNIDLELHDVNLSEVEHHFHYQNLYCSQYLKEVFRPPILV